MVYVFFLQNAVCFIILTYLVPVLFTFYIQGVLKLKKNNPGAKRLMCILVDTVCRPRRANQHAIDYSPLALYLLIQIPEDI